MGGTARLPVSKFLSRRDELKVAWHVVPGKARCMTRPVGYGMIDRRGRTISRKPALLIRPYPTGRHLGWAVSRHSMPGYLHFVPRGQQASLNTNAWLTSANARAASLPFLAQARSKKDQLYEPSN